MQKGKYILFIVLAVIILIPVVAPFSAELEIYTLKNTVAERLEKQHLQTVFIAKEEVNWTKSGKELLIGNRLYDVKEYHFIPNGMIVTGIFDDEETAVQKQVEDIWRKQKNKQGIFLIKVFQVLANNYFQQHIDHIKVPSPVNTEYNYDFFYAETNIIINIPYPPPRV